MTGQVKWKKRIKGICHHSAIEFSANFNVWWISIKCAIMPCAFQQSPSFEFLWKKRNGTSWVYGRRIFGTLVGRGPSVSPSSALVPEHWAAHKSAAKVVTSNAKTCPPTDRRNCFQQFWKSPVADRPSSSPLMPKGSVCKKQHNKEQ